MKDPAAPPVPVTIEAPNPIPVVMAGEPAHATVTLSSGQKVAAPTTTEEEDRATVGQRRINLIWELTQATVAISITYSMIYCAVNKIDSKEITYAFISIVTMYFIRTNHTKIGGVPAQQVGR